MPRVVLIREVDLRPVSGRPRSSGRRAPSRLRRPRRPAAPREPTGRRRTAASTTRPDGERDERRARERPQQACCRHEREQDDERPPAHRRDGDEQRDDEEVTARERAQERRDEASQKRLVVPDVVDEVLRQPRDTGMYARAVVVVAELAVEVVDDAVRPPPADRHRIDVDEPERRDERGGAEQRPARAGADRRGEAMSERPRKYAPTGSMSCRSASATVWVSAWPPSADCGISAYTTTSSRESEREPVAEPRREREPPFAQCIAARRAGARRRAGSPSTRRSP